MGEKFGELLRRLRLDADKSMGEIARVVKTSVTYVSDVERGVRAPMTTEKILKIAAHLGVDAERLLAAAAESRGVFELSVGPATTPQAMNVGAALMRGWSELSEDQLKDIERILGRDSGGND